MTPPPRTWSKADYALIVGAMSLMGGFYWAIRGTSGYGGETGGTLAGFGWALLWYAFSRMGGDAQRRPYGTPWIIPAITFGIAFGGLTGYGVYMPWLSGRFYLNYPEGMRPVAAWTGYAMLFLCGLHWGGNAGCVMAWCVPSRPLHAADWAMRVASGLCGAVAAAIVVRILPQCFLPYYSDGLYAVPEYKTCVRALDSIRTIAPHIGSFLGFLAYEIARGDRRAVKMILTVALGFAIPFCVGGYWQTMHDVPLRIDWWKNWEMTIGLGGGLSLGLAFALFNQPGEAGLPPLGRFAAGLFRSGLPVWLPSAVVMQGAYDGWCEIRHVAPTHNGYAVILLLCAVLMSAAWVKHRLSPPASPAYALSMPSILGFQLLIIAMGYLTSIPMQWRFANVFLVTLYTIYIGSSLALIAALRRRIAQP